MQSDNKLNIREFFSVCHQLVFQAGKFMKEAFDSKNIEIQRKPTGEAYTTYDLKIQTFYLAAFKRFWPNLQIIGEEEQDYAGEIDFDYSTLRTDQVPAHYFEGQAEETIDLTNNKVILWIDPIDATSQFVKGKMNWATTLLGVSVNGKAKLGVIGRFYDVKGEDEYEWSPKCYFADADYPKFYVKDFLKDEIKEVAPQKREQKEKLVCAMMYFDKPERIGLVEQFTEIYRIGGAEGLAVAEGYSDFYVYRGFGYQKWDLCAGEAILKSIGGIATDPFGKEFKYEEEEHTIDCPHGQLICRSKEIQQKALAILNPPENKGKALPEQGFQEDM